MDYLTTLNPEQREAVLHNEGPAMIIAGAGSGKTRVLTVRIAHLIDYHRVDPFNILTLTFTNKAAKEMRQRIETVVGTEARNIWMGTFHSVFAKILRVEAPLLGYPSNFTIYDTDDAKSLLKNIVKEKNLDSKVYKPNVVLNRISAAKNRLIDAKQYKKDATIASYDVKSRLPELANIYLKYEERCFKAGAMDFDDLLFNTYKLLSKHPDALNKYQSKFRYILVDEYQDTNFAQYVIVKKLAARNRNIVVVGDDAQSIYAFRGADIQNILNFEKDYPELRVYKLEQNYRSTNTIVQASSSIIKHNRAQLPKSIWTDNDEGKLIDVIRATSDNEEGKLVAHSIYENKLNHQISYEDQAILYRTNSQSRAMEESLRKLGIGYRIVGGMSFYQRKEIKDLLAYLRLTVNPNDEQALRRVINYPKRGIGDTSVGKLLIASDETGQTLWDIVLKVKGYLGGSVAGKIDGFATMIRSFMIFGQKNDAYDTAMHIAKTSGVLRDLSSDKTIEGVARYENLNELLNGIKQFVDDQEREEKDLGSFLQEIALLTNADEDEEDDREKVTMMTIHSAKGLEFKNVYVCGLEEDLFPSAMMLSSREDLEEERRLFYVAITRAEDQLTLSYATSRYRYGRLFNCSPSRFLEEIDSSYLNVKKPKERSSIFLERKEKPAIGGEKITSKEGGFRLKAKPIRKTFAKKYTAPPDFKPDDPGLLEEGMRVEHSKFGFGVISKIDNAPNSKKAIVTFDEVGEKTLLLSFAKLKIHS